MRTPFELAVASIRYRMSRRSSRTPPSLRSRPAARPRRAPPSAAAVARRRSRSNVDGHGLDARGSPPGAPRGSLLAHQRQPGARGRRTGGLAPIVRGVVEEGEDPLRLF
jgi:hypothetical protein